jgi:hypothetical protein
MIELVVGVAGLAIGVVATVVASVSLSKTGKFEKLLTNIDKKTAMEVLNRVKNLETVQSNLVEDIKSSKIKGLEHLRSPKILRFNAFGEKGAKQSFVIGFFDSNMNGIILTSIYTRDTSRIYTKEIVGGEPQTGELLEEESQLINSYK